MNVKFDNRFKQMIMNKNFKKLLILSVFAVSGFQFLGCAAHQPVISDSQNSNNITSNVSSVNNINTAVNTPKKSDTELEKNKKLWREKNITNYNLTASLFEGGPNRWAEPVLIKVRNGKAISTELLGERYKWNPFGGVEDLMEGYKELNTIEKMFDYIQKGLDVEGFVSVKYDKNFGYPQKMVVNLIKGATDTGQTMIIRKFEVIK